ncbi:MFS transporter [Modicisalibacter sp. 'Wilcox']|uniref:MFS transporter n=1 Tax=Modicisalibacter sp. 'Wilcox' TaxID=2679914 RepID=UPI00079997A5|nr:MFS transporter [Modicisalibacter sp. 'Wilcox']KXS38152.1 MAG: Permease [Halomonadaceae bacterium T82-2]
MNYRDVIRQYPAILAFGFIAIFSGNLGQTFLVGYFQPAIAEAFSLSSGEFGIAYSLLTLTSGFLIFFIGPMLDWIAPRRFAVFVVLGMSLGILLLTLSPWLGAALAGLGLIRFCGQGLFTHLGTTTVAKQVPEARGSALALVTLAMPVGEAVLPSITTGALQLISWRELLWTLLGILLVVWLPLLARAPVGPATAPATPRDAPRASAHSPRPLMDTRFWRLSLMMLSIAIVNTGIFVFQSELTAEFGASPAVFALGFALAASGRVIGSLIAGRLVDRLGASLMGRVYLLPLVAGLLVAIALENGYGILAYMLLSGLVTGMQEPTVTSLLIQLWGSDNLAKLRSVFSAGMVFASGLAPAFFGVLLDAGVAFVTILALMAAMVTLGWLLAWQPLKEAARQPA